MSSKVFVGSLSWDTDENGLRGAFERFGEILECKVINDRETGRSRGFGFVTFASADHAQAAISEMDGQALDGRNIRVNEAQERQAGGGGGPRRSFGGGGGGGGGYGGGGGGGGGYGGGGRGGPRGGGGGRGPRGDGGRRDGGGGGDRW